MNKVISLTKRNLKRYYRDKSALFFSFLSVFIVVGLYLFFLADMQIETIKSTIENAKDVDQLIYHWVLGGLLCIPAVSVPLIILTFKVEDVVDGVQDDLYVTPANRFYIMLSYILAALVAGIIMTFIMFIVGEFFILLKGGTLLSIVSMLKVMGIISLVILAFSGFSFFIILPLKSTSSLIIVNTILNTLIGFFAGLYVPIGFLSEGIRNIIKAFPLFHATVLLRRIIMKDVMIQSFKSIPQESVDSIRKDYGVDLILGHHILRNVEMVMVLLMFGLIFYIGTILTINRIKRK